MRSRLSRGFTLVELLVVIGIIAVLISILLPALNSARKQAAAVKCLSQLREIGNAFQYYANDNKGYYPPAKLLPATSEIYSLDKFDFTNALPPYWFNFLNRYVTKNSAGYAVASAAEANEVKNRSVIWGCGNWDPYLSSGVASNPSNAAAGFHTVQTGYGMNGLPYFRVGATNTPTAQQYAAYPVGTATWSKNTPSNFFIKASVWGKNGAQRMLVGESKYWFAFSNMPTTNRGVTVAYVEAQQGDVANYTTDPQSSVSFWRHGKLPPNETSSGFKYNALKGKVAFNILYADGHVATSSDGAEGFRSIRMRFPG